ncbi:hypothetical protein CJF42_08335 [Pseudoalteromonas sp. NBT06-2]|uniref:DUF1285 domain-containing protein n=1 Tax=Pseudoalteromonas sp. NBT06-2 TaxID=2025950 RepID=UPI000BA6B083|nr:DUF1285 domain-containing protein [Pseudoalteromonas sp. NBT06-2]PAJ74807.1 hypothetical protein CJF42_08335 [Pseudoalteromonas sp. NBT06-2]
MNLSELLEVGTPPLDTWDPDYCGEMPIEIKKNGSWHYMNSPIDRKSMVKLFSTVLIQESNEYFLKTPVEKIKIQVEDAPFLITDWNWQKSEQGDVLCCIDNLGRKYLLCKNHPLTLKENNSEGKKGTLLPYLILNHGLTAKVSRNVYYQWAQLAKKINNKFYIKSANELFLLG